MTAFPVTDTVTITGAINAVRTTVAASTTDVLLITANGARQGVVVFNDTATATLKIGLGTATVTASNFSLLVGPGASIELPEKFMGEVRGIWTAVDGSARITELT